MNNRDDQRLSDILEAIAAIESHLSRGDLSDGLLFDAVRIRLLEICEAVTAIPTEVTGREPNIPWSQIARMRDNLAHRYFDTSHAVVQATVTDDHPELRGALARLISPPVEERTQTIRDLARMERDRALMPRRAQARSQPTAMPIGRPIRRSSAGSDIKTAWLTG